jgi:ribonucleoside-diphosphate reductase alpha chain
MTELLVKKRNGKFEEFDAEKVNKVLEWACEGVSDVNPSDVAMNAKLSISNKIKTKDIQEVLIQSAYNLISEDAPNYQFVAARLRLYALRKEVWGGNLPPRLLDHLKKNKKVYDDVLLESYSESEIHKIDKMINHDRDYRFTHAGIQQMIEKYLICDRSTKKIFETPQFAFMLIPMVLYAGREDRMELIKQAYTYISKFKINLPTPILAGVRSRTKYYSSCVLIDCGDSLDSIFTSAAVAGKYTARRSGIGINMGRIRAVGSSIRDSEVISTGIVPFLRVMESTVKSTSQNGLRGGCLKKGTKVLVVESVEIDGKIYGINDIINGEPAYKLLQNGKMINPL